MTEPIILDLSTWTRLAEVRRYADVFCGGDLAAAIRRLVNSGLSHVTSWYCPACDADKWQVDFRTQRTRIPGFMFGIHVLECGHQVAEDEAMIEEES